MGAIIATTGLLAAAVLLGASPSAAQSVHERQGLELGKAAHPATDDDQEARALAGKAPAPKGSSGARSAGPGPLGPRPATGGTLRPPIARENIDDDFVVFGYLQSETQVYHLRWHALTHVGSRFVGFDSNGSLTGTAAFTGRSSYLKAGGAAEAAGVKFVLVLASFSDGSGGTIAQVMTSPPKRATLVAELVALLAADSYSHGISLDLEFSWGPAVRDGITAFARELRTGLDTLGPGYEISIYTNAIYSSQQWDFDAQTGLTPSIDYMLYSMYDWASGLTARAISDFDNCLGASRMRAYLNDGLPPEKMVPVISAYSRRWTGAQTYGGAGSSATSSGFTDALFDTTLNPNIGSPALRYVRGDEAAWYAWNGGTSNVRTFEGLDGIEYKLRHALSFQDPSGTWSGRRLGGVGFWSLLWMAEFNSIDPRTGGAVARTRTYPHIYEAAHEIFAPPGTRSFAMETFSGLDFRWRDPNEALDTRGDTDGDSSRGITAVPGGGSALEVTFDFEGTSANQAIIAHEVLASPLAPGVADLNATLSRLPAEVCVTAQLYVPAALPDVHIRFLMIDGLGELESSPPMSLGGSGWKSLTWDLTDPSAVRPFPTLEPAFQSGNGILSTGPAGSRSLGFYGFAIQSDDPVAGTVLMDELRYRRASPKDGRYVINEFRYEGAAEEYVEIYGPAGPVPFGLALRSYSSVDGSVAARLPLSGTIADRGNGHGFLLLGDPGVAASVLSTGFSNADDDLADQGPLALQLLNEVTLEVHDNVIARAFGGLDDLVRRETLGVTRGGRPWLGEFADGRAGLGSRYAAARVVDGRHSGHNARDFAAQPATPGESNRGSLALPSLFDFEAPRRDTLQTFDVVRLSSAPAVGLTPSSNGGSSWRCVDSSGGGVVGFAGSPTLGERGGFQVTGEVYVPRPDEPAQAIAVGVCGSQGSRFFPPAPELTRSGYESGYWLIYENQFGVGLADGQDDHPAVWQFVHATNDQGDSAPVEVLGALPDLFLGVTPGQWATFSFTVNQRAPGGQHLVAAVNGNTLYAGPLPKDGPATGAFQVGFRENHPGAPQAAEGTWVDGIQIEEAP